MRQFTITFPTSGTSVSATILDNENKELADNLWAFIGSGPVPFVCHHTGSTGGLINCYPLPPEDFPLLDPPKPLTLCGELAGQIGWNGFDMLLLHELVTEPLVCGCGHVAQVAPEDLDDYMEACKDVWYHCFLYHKLATVVVSRKEGDA